MQKDKRLILRLGEGEMKTEKEEDYQQRLKDRKREGERESYPQRL